MCRLIAILLICVNSNVLFGQRDFYIPKVPITPFHDEPKQLKVSFGFDRGVCSDISYSLNNRFTIYTSGSYDFLKVERSEFFGYDYFIKKNDLTISSGIAYKHNLSKYNVEFITGASYASVDNHEYPDSDDEEDGFTQSNYLSVFIQLNISRRVEGFEHGVALRFSRSRFIKLQYIDLMYMNKSLYEFQNFNLTCFEPAFYMGGEVFKRFFVYAHLGFSLPLSSLDLKARVSTDQNNQYSTFTSEKVEQLTPFAKISFQYNFSL